MTTKEDLEKLEAELVEILKDIKEIDDIISEYGEKGMLNRKKAISKIREVRFSNQAVLEASADVLRYSSVSFGNVSNAALVSELRMQRDVLQTDYLKKGNDAVAMRGIIMSKYSYEFKKKVVEAYLKGKGGYKYLCKKCGIKSHENSKRWVATYRRFRNT